MMVNYTEIDSDLRDVIRELNNRGIVTTGCCSCGAKVSRCRKNVSWRSSGDLRKEMELVKELVGEEGYYMVMFWRGEVMVGYMFEGDMEDDIYWNLKGEEDCAGMAVYGIVDGAAVRGFVNER